MEVRLALRTMGGVDLRSEGGRRITCWTAGRVKFEMPLRHRREDAWEVGMETGREGRWDPERPGWVGLGQWRGSAAGAMGGTGEKVAPGAGGGAKMDFICALSAQGKAIN